jgi:quercetin dioxygenase-like cupin family protein
MTEVVSENLRLLREITPRLPPLNYSDLVQQREVGCDLLQAEKGTLLVWGIWKQKDIAICRAFASAGTVMTRHTHSQEREWIMVTEGKVEVVFDDGSSQEAGKYSSVVIEPGIPHTVHYAGDTWTYAVTMPADPGFPDAH